MKCLVVLSHLMSKKCELSDESVARSRLATQRFCSSAYRFLITLGWAYREDCPPIAEVMKEHILSISELDWHSIVSLSSSRDTVGDAYYCLEHLDNIPLSEIHVVTSDYHVKRVELIFGKMFQKRLKVKVFGVKTPAMIDPDVLSHERKSTDAFIDTFAQTDFTSTSAIFNTLAIEHPYYNGVVHPSIKL